MGAWIEIIRAWFIGYFLTVAPLVGAWIEIESIVILSCVISCRSSRGSVDWNKYHKEDAKTIIVAPLVGAWIEMTSICQAFHNG